MGATLPRIAYIDKKFRADSLAIITQAQAICERYQAQGLTLTLRQIYYQFVSKGLLENKQTNYDRLGSILNDARLAGMLDWSYMEDRTRFLRVLPRWTDPAHAIESIARQYRIDLWRDQPTHIECWIEKDALVGVIENVCNTNRIGYTACRGYFSQSETWEAGQRFSNYLKRGKTRIVVLHLGDHDPSGIDMTRDMQERLNMFAGRVGTIEVRRIALNMDQIDQYDPPPNPAKLTDSRADGYIDLYGESSWELDALEPSVISQLIQDEIDLERGPESWDAAVIQETEERAMLEEIAANYDRVRQWLKGDDYA